MKTKFAAIVILTLCTLLLLGCYTALTPEQKQYAGEWKYTQNDKSITATLIINESGSGNYLEKQENLSTKMSNVPIIIDQNTITIGISILTKKMSITTPPHQEGNQTIMILDGKRYVKQQ
jgi:hypothetical protein